MKTKLFFIMTVTLFSYSQSFAQLKSVNTPFQKKMNTTSTLPVKKITTEPKKQVPPQVPPTDLQNAVVNIVVGDDGKDKDTYVAISIVDDNKRTAAYYGIFRGSYVQAMSNGEYFPGDNETLPTKLDASEPTGQIDNSKFPPLPVVREANVSDFANGGTISILIHPNGHDTWKIKSFTVTLYFNNDTGSPHRMTWDGFTLSQDSQTRILEFDKNFNPIQ